MGRYKMFRALSIHRDGSSRARAVEFTTRQPSLMWFPLYSMDDPRQR